MRTTVVFEDNIYHQLKKGALNRGLSFKGYLNQVLKQALQKKPATKKFQLKWKTVQGKKPPTVDIRDRDFHRFDGLKVTRPF